MKPSASKPAARPAKIDSHEKPGYLMTFFSFREIRWKRPQSKRKTKPRYDSPESKCEKIGHYRLRDGDMSERLRGTHDSSCMIARQAFKIRKKCRSVECAGELNHVVEAFFSRLIF